MKIVFWSPFHGQTGVTSNILTASIIAGSLYKKQVLLTQTQYNFNNLEAPLVDLNSGSKSKASAEFFMDVGLDALVRCFKSSKLDKVTIDNCCISLQKANVKLLPGTSKNNRESFEFEMEKVAQKLFREVDKYVDAVFIDAGPADNQLSFKLCEDADLTVINLNQNLGIVDMFFSTYRDKIKGKVFYLFGSYDYKSKYNISNIRRRYKEITVSNSGVIPYNTGYMDSQVDGKAADFIRYNLLNSKKDENHYYIEKAVSATDKILKLAEKKLSGRKNA